MIRQGIFLADGPSDLPLARHLETLCALEGVDVALTRVDPRLLPTPGCTVAARLENIADIHGPFEVVFIHRDAESQNPDLRYREVTDGVAAADLGCPSVAVVPVRMTEAWLLLDEQAIRRVAGKPRGRTPLDLPPPNRVEKHPDPKACLQSALLTASETTGRRRKQFSRDFGRHRALLLDGLDVNGPVTMLSAWRRLREDLAEAMSLLRSES